MANVDEAPAACLVACVYVCWGRKVSGVLSVALAGTCSRTTLSRGGGKGDGRVDKHAAPLL